MALVAQGFKNKEMAEKMFISERAVRNHVHNIFDILGVSDRDDPPPSTSAAAALPIPRRRSGLVWADSGRKRPQGLE